MSATIDDGTNSFLEFLSRAQAEEASGNTEALADANLLTTLTKPPPQPKARSATRTPAAAKKTARSHQSPKASQSWKPEQDDVLRKAVAINGGKNWKQIAASVPGKSPTQCLHRWQRVLNPNVVKGPWKIEEDTRLRELVAKIGSKHWSRIAQEMRGRNGKQCRERYINHLKPDILKEPWSRKEEEVLLRAYAEIGSKWAEMEKILPGRTENAIKNHWHSTLRKSRTMEDLRQNEQNRAMRRKKSSKPSTTARNSQAKKSSALQIDTSSTARPAAGPTDVQRVSPVFSPVRTSAPDATKDADAAAALAQVFSSQPTYQTGEVLVAKPDAGVTTDDYKLCHVRSTTDGGELNITWLEPSSQQDGVKRERLCYSSGATLSPGSSATIDPQRVLLKLPSRPYTDDKLVLTEADCAAIATIAGDGASQHTAKRAKK